MLLLASPGETPYEQPVLHSRLRGIAEAFKAKIVKTARHPPKSSLLCLHRQPSVPVNLSHKSSHFGLGRVKKRAQTTTTRRTVRYGAGNAELQVPELTIRPLGSSAPSVDFNALCTRAARSSQRCSKSDSVVGVRFVLPERIVIARLTRALIVSNGNLPQCKLPLAPTFIYLP